MILNRSETRNSIASVNVWVGKVMGWRYRGELKHNLFCSLNLWSYVNCKDACMYCITCMVIVMTKVMLCHYKKTRWRRRWRQMYTYVIYSCILFQEPYCLINFNVSFLQISVTREHTATIGPFMKSGILQVYESIMTEIKQLRHSKIEVKACTNCLH